MSQEKLFRFITASIGSSETDILHGLTDIFDSDGNFVFNDGASSSQPKRRLGKKTGSKSNTVNQDDNNNDDDIKSGAKSVADWLSSFGMIAYTDDFARSGFVKVGDLIENFDRSSLDDMKLAAARTKN